MHLGNVHAALLSWLSARKRGGRWLLRIEDLDRQRCRPEFTKQLLDDLRWLGMDRDGEPVFQSERDALYENAFVELQRQGLVYGCFCRRADLLAASAPHAADGTPVYSGRCRALSDTERHELSTQRPPAWRVMVGDAESAFTDGLYGPQACKLARDVGDFVVRRADGNFAYQLAVVVDDALTGVTEVVRGRDLLASTHQQLFLYRRLSLRPPVFRHFPLLVAPDGRRLSKRDRDADMGVLRERHSPEALIGGIMHLLGFIDRNVPLSLNEALELFSWERMPQDNITVGAAFGGQSGA